MKHFIIISLILVLSGAINAQKTDTIFQFIGHRHYNYIQPKEIKTIDSLPIGIREIASDFIKNWFGIYSSKTTFYDAQIFPIDLAIINNIKRLKERNNNLVLIPYYDLNYSFRDTSIGISQYWVNIGIDKFGQIMYCNFPSFYDNNRRINSFHIAKVYSDSVIMTKCPQCLKEEYTIDLKYNKNNEILYWEICYQKNLTEDNKEYHCLLINAQNNEIIDEQMRITIKTKTIDICCDLIDVSKNNIK